MSLMGGLYIGTSGLQTSQNALHTTGHNLSNIDTVGYTRQQVLQGDKRYNTLGMAYISKQQTGLGVNYDKVRQVRDFFLDKSYRLEAGRSSFYATSYDVTMEIETLFGEMEGVEFGEALSDLWSTVQELKKDPADATNQGMVVNKASAFLERAQAVYNGLIGYQDNVNQQIKDRVDTINDYGDKIRELNLRIVAVEAGGTEEANDLRDARNQLLDELSQYCKVTYDEDTYGCVTVQLENKDFVTRGYVNYLETPMVDPETGFYDVVWSQDSDLNGNKVPLYDLTKEISSATNTDVGGLKALLLLRGSDRGTYRDLPVKPNEEDFALESDYIIALNKYNNDVDEYNKTVNKSLIQNTMAEFDRLVNGIVTGMNEILNPEESGQTKGFNLFLRVGVDESKTNDPRPAEEDDVHATWWVTSNLKMNPMLLQQYSYLGSTQLADGSYTKGFRKEDGSEDRDMSDALAALFADTFSTLNPNANLEANFKDYYKNLVGDLSIRGNVYKNMAENEDATVESIDASRQQIIGVSDNEELTNMIMFQNAYNASSRYITTINDMLGTLIQSMGV